MRRRIRLRARDVAAGGQTNTSHPTRHSRGSRAQEPDFGKGPRVGDGVSPSDVPHPLLCLPHLLHMMTLAGAGVGIRTTTTFAAGAARVPQLKNQH